MDESHRQHDLDTEQTIIKNVEKYGCHIALLEGDDYLPGFAYSIGLFKTYGHPEIICFGLDNGVMGSCINHARDLIKEGQTFQPGVLYKGFLDGYEIQFVQVEKAHYPDYLGYAGWFNDNSFDFPVLQMVWPDKQHKFPWEEGFSPDWQFKQPLLDRNTDFKFYEERNLGVFTTQDAFDGDPILYVYHDDDGDWQFHTKEDPTDTEPMYVCLEEITKLDPSINKLFHLKPGWSAWRTNKETKWEVGVYDGSTEDFE